MELDYLASSPSTAPRGCAFLSLMHSNLHRTGNHGLMAVFRNALIEPVGVPAHRLTLTCRFSDLRFDVGALGKTEAFRRWRPGRFGRYKTR